MSDLLYAVSEIFVGLMSLAILFGVILMVLVSGVLLDEARRTGAGWTRRRKRNVSAVNGKNLRYIRPEAHRHPLPCMYLRSPQLHPIRRFEMKGGGEARNVRFCEDLDS
jgi:hypothetical protein